ncbi:LIC_10705 family lipoprotein [Leptospira yasudae]|uniref:LIC_10705 family lipoprotein n=1 Tax=Leptospira yasudae TaxID=2202201 RepID=UPI003D2E7A5C
MLKKALVLSIAILAIWNCENLKQPDFDRGTTAGIDNNFLLTYGFFFIVPNLDFNQFCPPTDQIPILEPGTHTRFMQAGDTYIFDNRARLQPTSAAGERRYFTLSIQENLSQEIRLVTPECGNSPDEFKADDDSGLTGQLETLSIALLTPPLPQKRSRFFTKLKALSGSGTVTFTTPSLPDPPQ